MMWVLSQCYREQYGVRSVNLIVPNMYGPFDSVNPNKTHALNALVIKFVKAVARGEREIEVWGTGRPIREWLYVGDFAHLVRRTIENGEDSLDPVNLAQNKGETVMELVELIKRQVGFSGDIVYNTKYQDGSPKKVMDDAYFQQRFPGFTFTPLEEGIARTVEYYQGIL
jgi:GDP-L-fucose synthase